MLRRQLPWVRSTVSPTLGRCYRQPMQPTATGADERVLMHYSRIASGLLIHSKNGQPSYGSILRGESLLRSNVIAIFLRGLLRNQYEDWSDCVVKEETEDWNHLRSVVPQKCTTMTSSSAGFTSRDGRHPDTHSLRNTHSGRGWSRVGPNSVPTPNKHRTNGCPSTVYTVQDLDH